MNITEFNEALLQLREAMGERDRWQRELSRVERSLGEEREALRRLQEELQVESEDVQRLEGLSLVGLFYRVIGSRQEHLEEERREMLAAKLKHDNALRRVETLERDAEDLRRRIAGKRGLDERYAALMDQKEAALRQSGGEQAEQLVAMAERLAGARTRQKELREAVQAGELAERGLRHAVEALESAQGWGTWDMLGGGMISSAVKHSKLDEANEAVRTVQPLLQRFERELADVGGSMGLNIESGGMVAFVDVFVDNILTDLMVQSRIDESLEGARAVHTRVMELLGRLKNQETAAQQEVQAVEMERQRLLAV